MDNRRSRPDDRIALELTDALYQQAPVALVVVSISIGTLTIFQWNRQDPRLLVPWVLLHLMVVTIRALTARAYWSARQRAGFDPGRWARLFTVTLGACGLLWGLAAVMFFDVRDPLGMAFLMIYDGGLVAACLIVVSSHLPAFLGFTLLTLIPLLVRCLLADSSMHRSIGVAIMVFLALCVVASRRLNRILVRSAELRFQNEDLAVKLKREKDRVLDALLAKSKFLAAASHDLRQPLHALGIFVELLAERVAGRQERAFLERIQSASGALQALLNGLLDLSRIDSQTLEPRPQAFPLRGMFRQLELEFAEQAERKHLRLDVRHGDLAVRSDPDLLGRVLRNLLANAIRYTSDGAITLEAIDSGGLVAVSIADTGPGIEAAEQSRVFDEFYQVGNPERDRDKGLGLGLSIVRGLCQLLGHPLRLISLPERQRGTEFVIELPAAQLPMEPQPRSPLPMNAEAAGSLNGLHVLVIDDERDIRAGMDALLSSWRCQVTCAPSPQQAIEQLAGKRPPDLVICDYRLRDNLTGTRALADLEQHFQARLPALLITGDTSPDRIVEARASGHPLLFKPVLPGKLRAAMAAVLTA